VPSFAGDYLPGNALGVNKGWPENERFKESVVEELRKTNKRIFQEVFMLDKRLTNDLEIYCHDLSK